MGDDENATLRDLRRDPLMRRYGGLWVRWFGFNVWNHQEITSGLDRLISQFGARALARDVLAAIQQQQQQQQQKEEEDDEATGVGASSSPSQEVEEDGEQPRPSNLEEESTSKDMPGAPLGEGVKEASPPHAAARDGQADHATGADQPSASDASSDKESGAGDAEGPVSVIDHRPHNGGPDTVVPGTSKGIKGSILEEEPAIPLEVPTGILRVPITSFGGDSSPSWAVIQKAAKKSDVKNLAKDLRDLIRKIDLGGVDESPRLDGRRFVRELVSHNMRISRAVRKETSLPLLLLACDVSGSCSATCLETLVAALLIAEEFPEVLVIRHSNGYVVDLLGQQARRIQPADTLTLRLVDVVRLLGRPIAALIAWGDMDAGDDYQTLCEQKVKVFLLDSYAAKYGARPASRLLRAGAASWKVQPIGWWQGVHDPDTTRQALRCFAKEAR